MQDTIEMSPFTNTFCKALNEYNLEEAISLSKKATMDELESFINYFLADEKSPIIFADAIIKSSSPNKETCVTTLLNLFAEFYDRKNTPLFIDHALKKLISKNFTASEEKANPCNIFDKFVQQASVFSLAFSKDFTKALEITNTQDITFLFSFRDITSHFTLIHYIADFQKRSLEKTAVIFLKTLIDKKPSVTLNAISSDFSTPLTIAAANGNFQLVEVLCDSLSYKNNTSDFDIALRKAVKAKEINLAKQLFEKGANPLAVSQEDMTALSFAVHHNLENLATLFLEKIENKGRTELGKYLFNTIANTTNEADDLPKIKLLLKLGADVNYISEKQQSVLSVTLFYAHDKIFDILKKHKGLNVKEDPNKVKYLRQAYVLESFDKANFLIAYFTLQEIQSFCTTLEQRPIHSMPAIDSPFYGDCVNKNKKIHSHLTKALKTAQEKSDRETYNLEPHNSAGVLMPSRFFSSLKSRMRASHETRTDAKQSSEIDTPLLN